MRSATCAAVSLLVVSFVGTATPAFDQDRQKGDAAFSYSILRDYELEELSYGLAGCRQWKLDWRDRVVNQHRLPERDAIGLWRDDPEAHPDAP
jgi:hypothetical protein